MKDSEKLYKLLDCEMEKIAAKPELNDATLSNLYKLVDVKKDLLEIEKKEMEIDEMESGNSYRVMYADNYPRSGNSNRNSYRRGGNSNRRGGRYYSDGYSMDDGGDVFDYLEDAMSHARSEQEREAIRQAMMKLDK